MMNRRADSLYVLMAYVAMIGHCTRMLCSAACLLYNNNNDNNNNNNNNDNNNNNSNSSSRKNMEQLYLLTKISSFYRSHF